MAVTPLPIIDVDAFLGLLQAGSFLKFCLVCPVTAGTAETATAGPTGPRSWERGLLAGSSPAPLTGLSGLTAADGQADGEDGQGDEAGNDEGKGGGEERLERPRVGLRGLQAPVAAVHCAAEKPGARGPAVLISGRGERSESEN